MKKNLIYSLLPGALALGLIMGVASCKDDENDNEPTAGQSAVEGLESNEETILSHLIRHWTDINELSSGWQNATYEATEGIVYDETTPFVRSVCVGTLEGADAYAVDVLSPLGIDYEHPSGFSYSNTAVGSVTYMHSDDGNVLATIDVNIRQLPNLHQLQLIKDAPVNAAGTPYYSLGDIVRYNGDYYICVNSHQYGQTARWITFDGDHTVGTCSWLFTGKDSVYSDNMASASTIADWITNILLDDEQWTLARDKMKYRAKDSCTVVPPTVDMRRDLIKTLMAENKWITDAYEVAPQDDVRRILGYFWGKLVGYNDRCVYAPVGYLLCDNMRWTNTGHYWVPYVKLVEDSEFYHYYYIECETPSQSTLSPSHFKWSVLRKQYPFQSYLLKEYEELQGVSVCTAAIYWTHKSVPVMDDTVYPLLNFTKNWKDIPNNHDPITWCSRNITSREITFSDKGKMYKGFDVVYVKSLAK